MSAVEVYLGLGSNLGEAAKQFTATCRALAPEVRVTARSSLYRSRPYGFADQPDFTNAVVRATTTLAPQALLAKTEAVEEALGKAPVRRNGPRLIDLDVLLYGDLEVEEEGLTIPHPGVIQRDFVLVPLLELNPDLRHPRTQQRLQELSTALKERYITGAAIPW